MTRTADRPKAGTSRRRSTPPTPVRRRRFARLRRPWIVVTALALVVLLGAGGYVLGFTSVVAARSVEVTGVREGVGSAAAVEEAAALPLGGPMLRVDTAGAVERVEGMRWVREATLTRGWTTGVLTVDVIPREDAAVIRGPRGEVEVSDADGVVFRDLDDQEIEQLEAAEAGEGAVGQVDGLPVIDVASDDADPADIAAAVAVWQDLPEELSEQVSGVGLAGAQVQLTLTDGIVVTWGTGDRHEAKTRIVSTLLDQPQVRQAPDPAQVEIDVSAPGSPVLRGGAVIEPEGD